MSKLSLMFCMLVMSSPLCARDLIVQAISSTSVESTDQARDYLAGAQVFFDSANLHGGVQGRKLVLRSLEADTVDRVREAGRAAMADADVVAFFGVVGESAIRELGSSAALRDAELALFAPLTGDDVAMVTSAYLLRASHAAEATRVVDWFAANQMTTIAIVQSTGHDATARAVLDRIASAKMRLLANVVLGANPTTAAESILRAQPQVVIVLGDSLETGQFVKAFRSRDRGIFVVALSNVSQQTLSEMAGASNAAGTLLSQVVPGPRDIRLAIVREHLSAMKQFRDEPASHLTIEGYIAAKALVAVLRNIRGPVDRHSVWLALRQPREIDTGGLNVTIVPAPRRGSAYVDLTMLRKDGTLLQ